MALFVRVFRLQVFSIQIPLRVSVTCNIERLCSLLSSASTLKI